MTRKFFLSKETKTGLLRKIQKAIKVICRPIMFNYKPYKMLKRETVQTGPEIRLQLLIEYDSEKWIKKTKIVTLANCGFQFFGTDHV